MEGEHILIVYSSIAVLTGQMLAAARIGEWDTLIALEKACSAHFARLLADEDGRACDVEH